MSCLKIFLLGSPRFERDGVPIVFDTRKNIALLAYLAITGEWHTREALVTMLWPELEPSRARANLRRNLSVLKKELKGEWLAVERETIFLDRRADIWIDVVQFRSLHRSWQGHGHPQTEVCPKCLTDLSAAVELYRENFMAGFSLRDSPAFDEWQFFQAQGLCQEFASSLERLVNHYKAHGKYKEAIPYAQRWLSLDPMREPVHRHLMQLYAWSDQRAAALRQYSECERILKAELGVPPDEETLKLYQTLQKEKYFYPHETLVTTRTTTPKHNLPIQSTPFVGREVELTELVKLLSDPVTRLVTIVGAGGMGKTRLALKVGETQLKLFNDGVYCISLAPLQTVDSIMPTVAKALGFTFYEGNLQIQQLLDYLRQKCMLLIMDNFEHLLDGVDLVIDILQTAPSVKILSTSRTRLNLKDEYLFPIGGMEFPDLEPELKADDQLAIPEDEDQYSAIQLFLHAARRLQPGFNLTNENYWHVIRICRMVQGMPLAILLAAGWIGMLSPSDIAIEIDHGLDFLVTSMRDVPTRQRSLRAVFDHSWQTLDEREQQVFCALSIFRGGFSRQAAEHVIASSLPELKALADKSLLQTTPTGRFELHELLRQYAAEKLERLPAKYKAIHNQHTDYFAALLQQLEFDLKGSRPLEALATIETESENARLAWTWAVEQGQLKHLEQAMEGLLSFYMWRRRYKEGETMCRLATDNMALPTTSQELRVLSKMLMWRSGFNLRLGKNDFADQLIQDSLAILDRPELNDQDTRAERATGLLQRGHIIFDSNIEEAFILYKQSLRLYQAVDDRRGMADAQSAMSWANWHLGAYEKAEQLTNESLGIRKSLGDQRGFVEAHAGLGFMAMFQGKYQVAERLILESIALLQEIGVQADLFNIEESEKAYALYQESVGLYSDLGISHGLAPVHSVLGFIKKHLGQYEEASRLGQVGLALARLIGWHAEEGFCLQLLGEVALAEGIYLKAKDYLKESIRTFRATGQVDLADALAVLGYITRASGELIQAKEYLAEAVQTSIETRVFYPLTTALPAIALLMADRGDLERAVELYALVSRYPRVANSRWYEDIAGKYIATVVATLPLEVVASARERGEARDLETTVVDLLIELAK